MKNKILKSVLATFALVATLAVMPMASESVEAGEYGVATASSCAHGSLTQTRIEDENYLYVNYAEHVYIVDAQYRCDICGQHLSITTYTMEDHYDDNGDGMCVCGTYCD